MKKILKSIFCFASTSVLLSTSLNSGISARSTVSADLSAFPTSIQSEITELQAIRAKALQEYNDYANEKCTYNADVPSDFRVLFVETQNVITNKENIVQATEEDNEIFNKVPEQFEMVVEYISNYNVNIITDTLIIDEPVTATTDYVLFQDIQPWLEEIAPFASYDSVLVFSPENHDFGCPNTSIGARTPATGFSYAWVPIAPFDHQIHEPNPEHHLYSVDLAIHEWLHAVENFRDITDSTVIMPSMDIQTDKGDIQLVTDTNESYYTNTYYKWDDVWPADTVYGKSEEFYRGREPERVAYARAMMNGTLYDCEKLRYLGMFPTFWKFFNGKTFLGEFYAQNSAGEYAAFLGTDTASIQRTPTPDYNDNAYIWRLCYSYEYNTVHAVSEKFTYWGYDYTETGLAKDTFTQVSFTGPDTYYIYNQGAGKYLSYDETTQQYVFSKFSTDDNLRWIINYSGDNFYTISPKTAPERRFDIFEANDIENNPVNIHVATGYDRAQTFQFRLNSDNTYSFYPLLSQTRCVKESEGKMVIATGNNSDKEKWVIKKADEILAAGDGQTFLKGDIDMDGAVTAFDIAMLKKGLSMGFDSAKSFFAADVDESGTVEVVDLVQVIKFVMAQTDAFTVVKNPELPTE